MKAHVSILNEHPGKCKSKAAFYLRSTDQPVWTAQNGLSFGTLNTAGYWHCVGNFVEKGVNASKK